jgi:hypothetical protein
VVRPARWPASRPGAPNAGAFRWCNRPSGRCRQSPPTGSCAQRCALAPAARSARRLQEKIVAPRAKSARVLAQSAVVNSSAGTAGRTRSRRRSASARGRLCQ